MFLDELGRALLFFYLFSFFGSLHRLAASFVFGHSNCHIISTFFSNAYHVNVLKDIRQGQKSVRAQNTSSSHAVYHTTRAVTDPSPYARQKISTFLFTEETCVSAARPACLGRALLGDARQRQAAAAVLILLLTYVKPHLSISASGPGSGQSGTPCTTTSPLPNRSLFY